MLLLGLLPLLVVALRATPLEGVVALELAATIVVLVLLLLAEGFKRGAYFNVSLILVVLAFIGGLVFVRFLRRVGTAGT